MVCCSIPFIIIVQRFEIWNRVLIKIYPSYKNDVVNTFCYVALYKPRLFLMQLHSLQPSYYLKNLGWMVVHPLHVYIRMPPYVLIKQVLCKTLRYGTLNRVMWYFVEAGMVLWIWWCGTLKRVMWYFEEGDVVLCRGWCGTLKRVVWYFVEAGMVLWRGWCGTLKRVVWYFVEAGMVLWRGWCGISVMQNFEVRFDGNHWGFYRFVFFAILYSVYAQLAYYTKGGWIRKNSVFIISNFKYQFVN